MNKLNLKQVLLIILFIVITILTIFQTVYFFYLLFVNMIPNLQDLNLSSSFVKFDFVNFFIRMITLWILYGISSWLIFRLFKSFRK